MVADDKAKYLSGIEINCSKRNVIAVAPLVVVKCPVSTECGSRPRMEEKKMRAFQLKNSLIVVAERSATEKP